MPAVVKAAGYDPRSDFAGVSLVCRIPQVLVVKDFEDVTWNGIVAPHGAPRDVLSRLHAEIARATGQPEFRRKYLERGIEIVASESPEAFTSYIRSDADAFSKLVKDAGIAVE